MQALPFLLLHLYAIAVLCLYPLTYLVFLYLMWRLLLRGRGMLIGSAYFGIFITAPLAWLFNGYLAFSTACTHSGGVEIHSATSDVRGIFLKPFTYERGISVNTVSTAPDYLLKRISTTSPSRTRYVFPSERSRPAFRASAIEPSVRSSS